MYSTQDVVVRSMIERPERFVAYLDPAIVPIYDDKLDGVSRALSAGRGLRPRLIASASLMTKTKGIDRKSRVLATPFRDAFQIARPTIEKPVYVLLADHVAGCEVLKAALKKNRSPSAFRKQ